MTGDLYINKSKTSTSITVTRSNNPSIELKTSIRSANNPPGPPTRTSKLSTPLSSFCTICLNFLISPGYSSSKGGIVKFNIIVIVFSEGETNSDFA